MSAREMVQHINNLSSSGGVQAMDANYGVGAKISAATRNPAGVIYQSWQDGKGSMIQLWRDPRTGEYGLKQFRLPDGSLHLRRAARPTRPSPSRSTSTAPRSPCSASTTSDDTVAAPEGVPTPSRWFARYLNARYFDFPEGSPSGPARAGHYDLEDTDRNVLRRVRGMRDFLDEHAEQRGVVELTDCRVHWWILDDSDKRRKTSELPNNGHFGALYQGELYEMITGRGGTARLQQFGVLFGTDRVVLYVEPRNGAERALSANTARTQLLLNGAPLPYAEWAHEFREKMPQEIRDHMDAVIAGTTGADHSQTIMERLKNYVKLFRLSRYRTRRRRPAASPASASTPAAAPPARATATDASATASRASRASRAARPATCSPPCSPPTAIEAEATRPRPADPDGRLALRGGRHAQPDVLDDRAAQVPARRQPDPGQRRLPRLHRHGRLLVRRVRRRRAATRPSIDVVHEWFEQALVETVIGCQALQGERRWSPERHRDASSPRRR